MCGAAEAVGCRRVVAGPGRLKRGGKTLPSAGSPSLLVLPAHCPLTSRTVRASGETVMPLKELGLRRLWSGLRAGRAEAANGSGTGSGTRDSSLSPCGDPQRPTAPAGGLPLLQVWPSQDSPRGEADGQSFVFPSEEPGSPLALVPSVVAAARDDEPGCCDASANQHDSGIDSVQVSPCPTNPPAPPGCSGGAHPVGVPGGGGAGGGNSTACSPSPGPRRPSSALLHPDHARLLSLQLPQRCSPELQTLEDHSAASAPLSCSSSSASSLTSVAAASGPGAALPAAFGGSYHGLCGLNGAACSSRTSDSGGVAGERRRSSARYSLLDALDLEYALLRAAARGSVGPYSLSESLHKLTFTQSLAFPALARGLAGKRRRSDQRGGSGSAAGRGGGAGGGPPLGRDGESGLNAFAKVVTALVLVLVSVLVFGVVYKFVRT
ncbi:uncharacterized protein LOC124775801 [Schistocerca piceifrons]|uniref:uncharacterized protein LOC124775801 n=1 Tax=Schistocerca piceifrons TaxID=274613 RepID=UPI001F5E843F|nr:uncharacterized protein LOC124775801 [Schistocerca piceifrons]